MKPRGTGNAGTPKVGGGKSKNNMKYDPNATGEHSTYKRDPQTGEITNWKRWNKSDPVIQIHLLLGRDTMVRERDTLINKLAKW